MKDTLITARRKEIELYTWLVCFAIANVCNLYAIIVYGTPFMELFTAFFYVFAFACTLYAMWTILRILFYGITKLFDWKF